MLFQSLFSDPLYFFRFVVIIVLSICLHELGHGIAAIRQGDNTPIDEGHMTWNPVVHMGWPSLVILCFVGMAWGQMPVRPDRFKDGAKGRMLVAAAGPLTNFAIATVCILVMNVFARSPESLLSLEFFYMAAYINLGLGIFNLIPIPPLDGFSIFSEVFPSFQAVRNTQMTSMLFIILLVSGGLRFVWSAAGLVLRAFV